MDILWNYLKKYWRMCLLVLFLASINQIFSLLDPYVFRLVVDNYATKFGEYTFVEFLTGVSKLLLLTVAMAFISRVAKNFQDFYLNSITWGEIIRGWGKTLFGTALQSIRRSKKWRDSKLTTKI
jgi:ATP-binding cassette subfamily B protein